MHELQPGPTMGPVRWVLSGLVLLAACAGSAESGIPSPDARISREWAIGRADTFVHKDSGEIKTSMELLATARQLQDARRLDEALELVALVARFAKDPMVLQAAWTAEAALWRAQGNWKKAFDAILNLRRLHPDSAAAIATSRDLFEIAKEAIVRGEARRWLIFGYTSPDLGIDLMHQALAEAPQSELTVAYSLWFAEYLFQEERYRDVEKVCRFIATEHSTHGEALAQSYRYLGEIAYKRFAGLQYDVTPLREAEKQFHRIVEEQPGSSVAVLAAERLRQIDELLAAKQLMAGDFYRSRGWRQAAVLYYGQIVRDYQRTSVAVQAQERLRALLPPEHGAPVPEPEPGVPGRPGS